MTISSTRSAALAAMTQVALASACWLLPAWSGLVAQTLTTEETSATDDLKPEPEQTKTEAPALTVVPEMPPAAKPLSAKAPMAAATRATKAANAANATTVTTSSAPAAMLPPLSAPASDKIVVKPVAKKTPASLAQEADNEAENKTSSTWPGGQTHDAASGSGHHQ